MKLIDFVILLLKAHAATLKSLSELFGDEILLELIERAADKEDRGDGAKAPLPALDFHPEWLTKALIPANAEAGAMSYRQIKQEVDSFRLSPILEFYLWSYPFYRMLIESPLDLNSDFQGTRSQDAGGILVEKAMQAAELWMKDLAIPPELGAETQNKTREIWNEFQKIVLNKIRSQPFLVKKL